MDRTTGVVRPPAGRQPPSDAPVAIDTSSELMAIPLSELLSGF